MNPYLILAGLASLAISAVGGAWFGSEHVRAQWTEAKLEAADVERETRARQNEANQGVTDALIADRRKAESDAAGAADRLRRLAAVHTNPATEACRSVDAPEAAKLHESTRNDLVGLTREADDDVADLTACQQYVRTVILAPAPSKD